MSTARVYRRELDWAGSPVNSNPEDDYVGDITGVIMGGGAPQLIPGMTDVVSTESMIGVPKLQDSGVTLQQHDRLSMNGAWWKVEGPRQWDYDHYASGTDSLSQYYWVKVEADYGGLS